MDETLKQLGELLLGSVPTVIFLVLTYLAYTVLVHKPLSRILAERHERTDVAAAEARTAEYEQRLREARMAVFRTQEQKRQQATQLRASAVAEARSRAHALVEQERADIAKEEQNSKGALQAESQRLAVELMETVLRPVGGGAR
jgi:F-type H+-transporting ATPase subunit b